MYVAKRRSKDRFVSTTLKTKYRSNMTLSTFMSLRGDQKASAQKKYLPYSYFNFKV